MTFVDLKFAVFLLVPIVVGSMGNFSVLCHSIFLYFSDNRSRSTDLILSHLTVANLLVLHSRGIPEIMASFGREDFLSDVGCKLVFFVLMVGKGVSFSTTCLLSVFQAIIISPRSCGWAEMKVKAGKLIGPCTVILWVLHMASNFRVAMYVTDKWNSRNVTNIIDYQYCSVVILDEDKDKKRLFSALSLLHDILCLKLMVWSSGSMVFILYKHKQRTRHIHRHGTSPRSSPETRASQSIIILVCAFVSFYTLSSITYVWYTLYDKTAWWLVKASVLTNACFATTSPYILMAREHFLCRTLWKTWTRTSPPQNCQ